MRKRKCSTNQTPGTNVDDDEPPELSRCPSPVDETVIPRLVSTLPLSAKVDYRDSASSDPPSLTRSLPEDDDAAKDAFRPGAGVSSDTAKDFVMTRASVRRVGSPDDTLDSMSSSESSGHGDCLMPTLIADCDSSYGSVCGRVAGAATSDSEAATGSEPETEKTYKLPMLKNCDVC